MYNLYSYNYVIDIHTYVEIKFLFNKKYNIHSER